MFKKRLISKLLQVQAPWEIGDLRIDTSGRRCDIWIHRTDADSRIWFSVQHGPATSRKSWRHLNIFDLKTRVHVIAPPGEDLSALPWAGEDDHGFTHAMASQLLVMMESGMPLDAISRAMRVELGDLWRFNQAQARCNKRKGRSAGKTPAFPVLPAPQYPTTVAHA